MWRLRFRKRVYSMSASHIRNFLPSGSTLKVLVQPSILVYKILKTVILIQMVTISNTSFTSNFDPKTHFTSVHGQYRKLCQSKYLITSMAWAPTIIIDTSHNNVCNPTDGHQQYISWCTDAVSHIFPFLPLVPSLVSTVTLLEILLFRLFLILWPHWCP